MKTTKPYELTDRIYRLCNKENWFTEGTNRQYDRMFAAVKSEKFSTRDVAVIIGLCSESPFIDKIQEKIDEIYREVEAEAAAEEAAETEVQFYEYETMEG